MSLSADIAKWDGKSKTAIVQIYNRYVARPDFLREVVEAFDNANLQSGATWLLKHHFDEGGDALDPQLVREVYRSTPSLVHWDAKLHILQCVEQLPIPRSELPVAEGFIRRCLKDDAKFVRAWAYSSFHELAVQFPEYRPEVSQMLADALATETAGSVLSRVRRKLRQGF